MGRVYPLVLLAGYPLVLSGGGGTQYILLQVLDPGLGQYKHTNHITDQP